MSRRIIGLIIFTLILLPQVCIAGEASNLPAIQPEDTLHQIDLNQVEKNVDLLNREIGQAIPNLNFKDLVISLAKGEMGYHPRDFVNALLKYLFQEVVANAHLLGKLVVLAVICAVLNNVATAFEKASAAKLAQMAVYLVLITVALGSFTVALQAGREAVDNMVDFMHAMLPVLLVLLCAVGGIASAGLFHPVILTVLNASGLIVKNIVFPLVFFSAILGMASHFASGFSISRLGDLLRNVGLGIMGVCSTAFLGLLTIQGVAGAVTEGVTFRTAKFATQTFLPIVGKLFSDSMEAVIGSSLLVKNAVGLAGLLIIFLMALFPLIKIMALVIIYKLASALVQPVGETNLSNCLNSLGNSMVAVFAVVATTGLLFFFALAIISGMGNLTVMLR
ncbi:MAG: stage III sporulation protein AE [Peptococcaceae bacterium]|nr:stage III sporulation protein AE [Peptococcaceae bacterium]